MPRLQPLVGRGPGPLEVLPAGWVALGNSALSRADGNGTRCRAVVPALVPRGGSAARWNCSSGPAPSPQLAEAILAACEGGPLLRRLEHLGLRSGDTAALHARRPLAGPAPVRARRHLARDRRRPQRANDDEREPDRSGQERP